MKNLTSTFLSLAIILTITGCASDPKASFISDKGAYNKGETIHLTNTSSDAYSYIWTMPDGSTLTSQNADYMIDTNQSFGNRTFTLQVFSKNGKKSNSVSNSIPVEIVAIIKDSAIEWGTAINTKSPINDLYIYSFSNGNNWILEFYNFDYISELWEVTADVILPDSHPPTSSGYYSLQSDSSNLSNNSASVFMHSGNPDMGFIGQNCKSLSGTLAIYVNNGHIQAVYNNIDAKQDSSSTIIKMSGNFGCKQ